VDCSVCTKLALKLPLCTKLLKGSLADTGWVGQVEKPMSTN